MSNFKHHDGLIERIYWLIRLRWIAVIGVVATVLFVEKAAHSVFCCQKQSSLATDRKN